MGVKHHGCNVKCKYANQIRHKELLIKKKGCHKARTNHKVEVELKFTICMYLSHFIIL